MQIYVSAPGNKLATPYQELKAFVKSKELKPDEEQDITATFDIVSLASFDEKACLYIIEEGDYIVRYGEDSRHTKPAAILRFDKE